MVLQMRLALSLLGDKAVNVPGSTKTENINKPGTLTIRSHASLK